MMNLPNTCLVSKFIPKNKFYEKANINLKLKKDFVDLIKRITWKYKLSEETIGIPKNDEVVEIQIFEIELKKQNIPKNALYAIDTAIPYVILYKFIYSHDFLYGIALKNNKKIRKYYFSDWNENIDFEFFGKDLKVVYHNMIKKFIKRSIDPSLDLEKIIEIDGKMKDLEMAIRKLKKSITKEKQFKIKAEIHKEIKALNKQLNEIKNIYCI